MPRMGLLLRLAAGSGLGEPTYGFVKHAVLLAEREADERRAQTGRIAEDAGRDADNPRRLRQFVGVDLTVGEAKPTHIRLDEVRALRLADHEPSARQSSR